MAHMFSALQKPQTSPHLP